MIACLRGTLFQKLPESLIVDVGGVGYEVFFPQSGQARLPGVGEEVFLHIQTVVREDAFNLFGFLESTEKEMFQLLNTVSGIGPKLAMHILAGISPLEMARAILHDDLARLTRLPGVGKKTVEVEGVLAHHRLDMEKNLLPFPWQPRLRVLRKKNLIPHSAHINDEGFW